MKRLNFNVLNSILVVVLIFFAVYLIYTDKINNIVINKYNQEINEQETYIKKLKANNEVIDVKLEVLNDSIDLLKSKSAAYEDSLLQITDNYEEAVKEVRALSDSLTVIRFNRITSEHCERLGIDLDR